MPIVDTFLNKNDQYLPIGPIEALNTGNYHQIPILAGITTSEAEDSGILKTIKC